VDDLRTLSLADAGELTLQRQLVAPGELLERVAVAFRHQAEQQDIDLKVEIDPALPEIQLDPERMELVLGNLVSNALRYTPGGGQILLIASQAEGRLILSVRDNGSGIPPDVLPYIFERSYRGDPSRSGNESGLGLAIAKSIVELHGGEIRAKSDGKGSEISITLEC
jgi:two-component system, OmpR family, sensor histidine kinase BaeS